MTRHADVAEDATVAGALPALARLASGIGDKQVRAMGTLGGSLAHNDPAADYPAAARGLGAPVQTPTRRLTTTHHLQCLFPPALHIRDLIPHQPSPPPHTP